MLPGVFHAQITLHLPQFTFRCFFFSRYRFLTIGETGYETRSTLHSPGKHMGNVSLFLTSDLFTTNRQASACCDETLRTIAVTRSRIISLDRAKIKRNLARQPNKNNQQNNHYPNHPLLEWVSHQTSISHCVNTDRRWRRTGSPLREVLPPLCILFILSPFSFSLYILPSFRSCSSASRSSSSASLLSRSLRLIFFPTSTTRRYRASISPDCGSYIRRFTRDLLRNSLANEIKFLPRCSSHTLRRSSV